MSGLQVTGWGMGRASGEREIWVKFNFYKIQELENNFLFAKKSLSTMRNFLGRRTPNMIRVESSNFGLGLSSQIF